MEELNKLDQPIEVLKEKPKRRYIALTTEEVNDLIDTYRMLLRKETHEDSELIIIKIKDLERELKLRSKLPRTSK